jgi:hypothetical protein
MLRLQAHGRHSTQLRAASLDRTSFILDRTSFIKVPPHNYRRIVDNIVAKP